MKGELSTRKSGTVPEESPQKHEKNQRKGASGPLRWFLKSQAAHRRCAKLLTMSYYRRDLSYMFGGPLTPAVKNLIIANIVVGILQALIVSFTDWFALVCAESISSISDSVPYDWSCSIRPASAQRQA